MISLAKKISASSANDGIKLDMKSDITDNLNPKFSLRPYQIEALTRFQFYLETHKGERNPIQLLFHMATGSGKTLIMASCILELYQRGYRDFIFFVNSSNIIEKTRDNFLNIAASKYLFNELITIGNSKVEVKEVVNFEAANNNDITIVFSTIQGLHSKLNTPRENNLTYTDFEDRKIALLSDEAHHINAETKKGKKSKSEFEETISWEGTVQKIFNLNPKNILLEFTATADFSNIDIKRKYQDKLIFDYPLKKFRDDGYSKEVKILQADMSSFNRALQAVILSQYRRKIFEVNNLNIKPVILFKSKTIKESQAFYTEFVEGIQALTVSMIRVIFADSKVKIINKIDRYFQKNDISYENFISELKEDFSEERCIAVDSKNDSNEKQLIVNTLEDSNNEYRAVFAVDKLNEGWDVLNLFDIVKLYDTKSSKTKKGRIEKTTMSEAQLIGRGARYCPFKIEVDQPEYKRKYDEDLKNSLRICEELYYHAAHNPVYISDLNKALVAIGIVSNQTINAAKQSKTERNFKPLQTTGQHNRWPTDKISEIFRSKIYEITLPRGFAEVSDLSVNNIAKVKNNAFYELSFANFDLAVVYCAFRKLHFYRFNNVQKFFPKLKSMNQFISSSEYLNAIKISAQETKDEFENLTKPLQLQICIQILEELSKEIVANIKPSTDEFAY